MGMLRQIVWTWLGLGSSASQAESLRGRVHAAETALIDATAAIAMLATELESARERITALEAKKKKEEPVPYQRLVF